jgi:acetolactate synthase-1/2/3 large subunit
MLHRLSGAHAVVDALVRHGVTTLFTVPGEQIDPLCDALHDADGSLRLIQTRHEQGAAYLAYGYARSTGRAGCFAVVSGPGFLNSTAALATGYAGYAPMLCIAGQIPQDQIGRGLGVLHETPDQPAVMRAVTTWSARIERPADTPPLVDEAFRQLRRDRPGPVALEVPNDVLRAEEDVPFGAPPEPAPPPAEPDPVRIGAAARLLAQARRPLIFVGGGAVDAGDELLAVAELVQAPVTANVSGRGIIDARHYLAQTSPAGHRMWHEADVVLAVGTRFHQPQSQWGLDDKLAVVRVDIDPSAADRVHPPAVSIVADAKASLGALLDELRRTITARPSRRAELLTVRARLTADFATLSPQYEYLMAIRDELPEDGFFVEELTQVGYVARFAFPVYRPRTYVPATYQGTLGFGFPTALGVKVANPDRAVVSVCGDGGFLYGVAELATAALHGIAVVVVVFTDNRYGNVARSQREAYGRTIGVDLRNPDFVRLAESFGVTGVRATGPDRLRAELRTALGRSGTTVIEVPVGELPSPWSYIRMPRVRPVPAGGADD